VRKCGRILSVAGFLNTVFTARQPVFPCATDSGFPLTVLDRGQPGDYLKETDLASMVSANNESGLDADQYHTNGFYVQDQIGYASDPVNPDLYIQREEDQARGIERNGNIRSNLSIHFAYAYNLAKIKKSEIHQDIGRLKENAPVNSDGGFIKYRFDKGLLKRLSLMAGYNQAGKRNTLDPQIQLPGYIIFQGGASYAPDHFGIAMNWNNITNQTYWTGAYNNLYKWPGAPGNILFKISWNLYRQGKIKQL
jgi:hypothetical protein